MLKSILKVVLQKLYRVELHGIEHLSQAGERILVVANHLSFLDAALLAAFMPQKPVFAVNTYIAQQWWIKPFLTMV
ncbi:MAG TPA: 1-acyl-sn-glycerol-3-phosphate acyltransferase, partial [Nitrososphaera sp.]|nr:1-acyl-sn-glycerol-3-phosphate acyltransferase [Nitrososphaera sp.]